MSIGTSFLELVIFYFIAFPLLWHQLFIIPDAYCSFFLLLYLNKGESVLMCRAWYWFGGF